MFEGGILILSVFELYPRSMELQESVVLCLAERWWIIQHQCNDTGFPLFLYFSSCASSEQLLSFALSILSASIVARQVVQDWGAF
jgi:hypothetical protein